MKFLKYILALVLIAGTFAACDTSQDPALYDGPEYVRFVTSDSLTTEIVINDTKLVNIPVGVTKAESTNRTYSFEVVTESTTAESDDYSISGSTVTIPADSVIGYIPMTLNKATIDGSEVVTLRLTAPETASYGNTTITIRLSRFCAYDRSTLLGTYQVTQDDLFGDTSWQFELVAGDAPNEIIANDMFTTGVNVIMVLDDSDQLNFTVSVDPQLAWVSGTYGDVTAFGGGTFSQCDKTFSLVLEHQVSAGSYGENVYNFTKIN